MHLSMAVVILVPSLLFGARAWSASPEHAARSTLGLCPSIPTPPADERRKRMKAFANATALLVALSLMVGLLLAQRNYQNSWRQPNATQASASTVASVGTIEGTGRYKVVMK